MMKVCMSWINKGESNKIMFVKVLYLAENQQFLI